MIKRLYHYCTVEKLTVKHFNIFPAEHSWDALHQDQFVAICDLLKSSIHLLSSIIKFIFVDVDVDSLLQK